MQLSLEIWQNNVSKTTAAEHEKYEKIDFTFIEFSTSKTTEPYEGHFYN